MSYGLQGHSGPVNGLDWSTEKSADDDYMLRSSSVAMEIKYCKYFKINYMKFVEYVLCRPTNYLKSD
jgi:hypothetical protein